MHRGGLNVLFVGVTIIIASTCPKHQHANANAAPSLSSLPRAKPFAFRSTTSFLDPQSTRSASQLSEFCLNYNYCRCTFQACRSVHRCLNCNQSHPAPLNVPLMNTDDLSSLTDAILLLYLKSVTTCIGVSTLYHLLQAQKNLSAIKYILLSFQLRRGHLTGLTYSSMSHHFFLCIVLLLELSLRRIILFVLFLIYRLQQVSQSMMVFF